MANNSLFLKSGFIRAPLQNGVGRYISQLQRITLKFCKSHGSSKGIREFIENNLVDFAKENPSVVLYVKPRRHRSPVLVAEYLNGDRIWKPMNNETRDEIRQWLNLLKQQSGDTGPLRYRKHWQTEVPSIQGPWTPFTHKNAPNNLVVFPDVKSGEVLNREQTATEKLLELMEEKQLQAKDVSALSKDE